MKYYDHEKLSEKQKEFLRNKRQSKVMYSSDGRQTIIETNTYNDMALLSSHKDECCSYHAFYEYDEKGRDIYAREVNGSHSLYAYNDRGLLSASIDIEEYGNPHKPEVLSCETYIYDESDRLIETHYESGRIEKVCYNENGTEKMKSISWYDDESIYAYHELYSYKYLSDGRYWRTTTITDDKDGDTRFIYELFTKDHKPLIKYDINLEDEDGDMDRRVYKYDDHGRLIHEKLFNCSDEWHEYFKEYDENGNEIFSKSVDHPVDEAPEVRETHKEYNEYDIIIKEYDNDGDGYYYIYTDAREPFENPDNLGFGEEWLWNSNWREIKVELEKGNMERAAELVAEGEWE